MGSNYGLEIGDVARSLIEGYGSGEFTIADSKIEDQFILDNTKLTTELNISIPQNQTFFIKKLGEKL